MLQFTPEPHRSLPSIFQQQINLHQGHRSYQLSTISQNLTPKPNTKSQGIPIIEDDWCS
ncbi:unnamed protein product [Lupinus luteus]|uniref:Uncharacterized protein n=1 Tax=Lupinus luteus TaxID=3873 RepID=A0AAV1XA51_LUPLU